MNFSFAAEDFEANQWAWLHGFIIVKANILRSQPPLQRVGTETGWREIRPLVAADGTQLLIGIKDNGEIWRCNVPDVNAVYTTTNAASWTRLTSSNGSGTITVGTDAHFLTDIVFQQSTIASGRKIPALLINQSYTVGSGGGSPVYVWADTGSSVGCWRVIDGSGNPAVYPGYVPVAPSNVTATFATGTITVTWTAEDPGSSAITGWNIYSSTGVLKTTAAAGATTASFSGVAADAVGVVVRGVNAYGETPFDAGGGVRVPATGYIPRANVGAFWAGQLVLGDIEYYRDETDIAKGTALSSSNSARIRNGIWFSNPDAPSQFDPLASFSIGQPDSQITAMTVVPQGLLIFTKTISNDSGIFLLRGTSMGVILDDELALNFTQELIRGGIGTRAFANAGGGFNHVKAWPATGTVCFLDENSLLWQTNTQGVTHINETIQFPQTTFANSNDNICAWDKYLLFGSLGTLSVLREFGDRGGWTSFVLPDTTSSTPGPTYLQEMGNCVYFIWNDGTNKYVWRYTMQPTGAAQGEFGKINGNLADLIMATRPVRGGDDPHQKSFWHRIGLRFRGTNTFTIKSISSAPYYVVGNAFVAPGINTITNSPPTSYPTPANYRGEKSYPAHGPSIECQVTVVMQGSTEIEDITLYYHGKKPNRP